MVTLLSAVGMERITPKHIYFNVCYNEQGSRTNYVRSNIVFSLYLIGFNSPRLPLISIRAFTFFSPFGFLSHIFLAAHAWSLLVTFLSNSKLLHFTSATKLRIYTDSSCFL